MIRIPGHRAIEHRQAVAGSKRMDTGRGEIKAGHLPIQRGLRQIMDTNDEMIEVARHGISGLLVPSVAVVIKPSQSIVPWLTHKKIYCKRSAYR